MTALRLVYNKDHPVNSLSMLDAALHYADLGFRVFPLKEKQKLPAVRDWGRTATKDHSKILVWWERWPNANIGVITGEKSGIFVLDIDPKNGGDQSYDRLMQGRNLQSATQMTGSGGSHIFFKYDKRIKTRHFASDDLKGLDVQSNGAYVVVAPSVHENGNTYQWTSEIRLEQAPEWLIEQVSKDSPVNTDGIIPVGMRNTELFRIGMSLRGQGVNARELGAKLHTTNRLYCEEPLDDEEINKIVDGINQHIKGDRKPLFKYRDYIRSNEFPHDPALRHIAHVISFYMDENGKAAYPTIEQIAQDTGYGIRTVSRKIGAIKQLGLMQIIKNKQEKQKYANNIYLLPRRFYTCHSDQN